MSDYEPVAPARAARRGEVPGDDAEWAEWPTRAVEATSDAREDFETQHRTEGIEHAHDATPERLRLRRGHGLAYAGLFLFTAVLYFRPYEYLPLPQTLAFWIAISTLLVFIPTQLGLEGNLTARPREVNLVLLLCVCGLLSIPLAANPGEAWDTFSDTFLKAVLMFIVIVNVVRTRWRLRGLLFLALAVGCVLSVNAIRDFRAGNFVVEDYRVAGSIGGMFGNPNDMALHLVTVVPLALALLLGSRNILGKAVYGLCALFFAGGIVVTYSRGGFLGLAAAGAVLAWKAGKRHRLAVLLLVVGGLVLLFLFAPGNYSERLTSIVDFAKDPLGSASMRQQLFWRSLFTAIHNPVLGIGMGNFPIVSLKEQVTHNAYTQVAAEMGFPALVIYLLFIFAALKSLRTVERGVAGSKKMRSTYYLTLGLQASFAGYMVSSFFASVAYQWHIYYLVGYAVALRRMYEAETAETARSADALDAATNDTETSEDAKGQRAAYARLKEATGSTV